MAILPQLTLCFHRHLLEAGPNNLDNKEEGSEYESSGITTSTHPTQSDTNTAVDSSEWSQIESLDQRSAGIRSTHTSQTGTLQDTQSSHQSITSQLEKTSEVKTSHRSPQSTLERTTNSKTTTTHQRITNSVDGTSKAKTSHTSQISTLNRTLSEETRTSSAHQSQTETSLDSSSVQTVTETGSIGKKSMIKIR